MESHLKPEEAANFVLLFKNVIILNESNLLSSSWTNISVSARIRIATKHYFRNLKLWSKFGNERIKVTKWVEVFHGCILHGARNWHITASILREVRRVELFYLRKVLRFRRRKLEDTDGGGAGFWNLITSTSNVAQNRSKEFSVEMDTPFYTSSF